MNTDLGKESLLQTQYRLLERLQASEASYRGVFQHAALGMARISVEGRVLEANAKLCELLAEDAGVLKGRLIHDFGSPEDRHVLQAGMADLLADPGNTRIFGKRCVTSDGRALRINVSLSLVRDGAGEPEYIIAIFEDVSEKEALQDEIAQREARFKSIFDSLNEVVFQTDAEGRWLMLNPAWEEITGFSVEESIGRVFIDYVHPDDRTLNMERFAALIDRRKDYYRNRIRYLHKQGGFRWIKVFARLTLGPDGEIAGTTGTLNDVTASVEAEHVLRENEERFRKMANAAPVLIWVADKGKGCTWFNQVWLDFTGRSMDQELGDGWAEGVHPDDLAACMETYISCFDARRPFRMEYRLRRHDGEYRWLTDQGAPWFDAFGNFEGFIGSCIDVTDSIRLFQALQESEQRWKFALEGSGDGVWDWDLTTGKVFYSPRWKAMLGFADEEIGEGLDEWAERLHPEDREECHAALERHFRGETPDYSSEHRVRCRDGSYKWILDRGMVVSRAPDGQPRRLLGTHSDITERKRGEEALRKARDEAESAARIKSQFLANMSHEIRTPMNAVIGLTELVLDTDLDPKQEDYLGKVLGSSRHLLGILNDILDFSKIELGRIELENRKFLPESLLADISDLFSVAAENKGLEFFLEVAPDVPKRVLGDPLRIRQVLVNLVGNAVKFTDRGEIHIRLDVGGREGDALLLRFSVRDTGIGLSEHEAARLFRPFTQADSSTTRRFGGSGLGLAISRQLAELMGGGIAVASRAGEGSTFALTVRVQPAPMRDGSQNPHALRGIRVLVVDDQETARVILKQILCSWDIRVETSASGEDALRKIQKAHEEEEPFELLLLDWRMEGISGLELVRRVDAAAGRRELRRPSSVVMVTAHSKERLLAEAGRTATRIDAVLTKPVMASLLLETLLAVHPVHGHAGTPPARAGSAPVREVVAALRGARVLLVEDNALNQMVAMEFLKKTGVEVTLATHGGEAVEQVRLNRFDVVLMDLQMPVMDGYKATRLIRQLPGGRDVPIIAMTAAVMQQDREAAREAGMDDHISKPIDFGELVNVLVRCMGRKTAPGAEPAAPEVVPEWGSAAVEAQLPGFEVANLLSVLDGDVDQFAQILEVFLAEFGVVESLLDECLAADDLDAAEKVLHKLAGAAGNVGARDLHRVSRQLDHQIKAGTLDAATLNGWRNVLAQALGAIHRFVERSRAG
jgi:PAS domain S-box-containing protein